MHQRYCFYRHIESFGFIYIIFTLFGNIYHQCKGQTVLEIAGLPFQYQEVSRYEFNPLETSVALPMAFGSAQIIQPERWSATEQAHKVVYRIELVFSKYQPYPSPASLPYAKLMRKRIAALLALDSTLAQQSIEWVLVAQTDCQTKADAQALFHGWVLKYQFAPSSLAGSVDDFGTVVKPELLTRYNMQGVRKVIAGTLTVEDSIIFKTMARHPKWQRMLVVVDWTSSMYPYGAQFLRWMEAQRAQDRIEQLVFFNDGDDFKRYRQKPFRADSARPNDTQVDSRKPMGKTGGIYPSRNLSLAAVLETMTVAMNNGDGGDIPENNIEVLSWAMQQYKDVETVVMIADNLSPIRDLSLIERLKRPVHVILCNPKGYPPHPDYITVAWRTGGSIATLEYDKAFELPASPLAGNRLSVSRYVYQLLLNRTFRRIDK
jgi:hypothetical protein